MSKSVRGGDDDTDRKAGFHRFVHSQEWAHRGQFIKPRFGTGIPAFPPLIQKPCAAPDEHGADEAVDPTGDQREAHKDSAP